MDSSTSTSITSLPREILLKILTGLPAKSAVRFRCTSKFLYSFIPDPHFAFRILVALPSKKRPSLNLYSVSYSEESHGNLRADTAQRLDVRGLVCSADGKMCLLSQESGDDAVFDLSTRQRICLPSIGLPAGLAASSFSCIVCPCAVLGFDLVSERYKVFKSALYYIYDSGNYRLVLNRLCVLTVGVDKSWREIDSSNIIGYTSTAVSIHGIIYLIPLITPLPRSNWKFPLIITETMAGGSPLKDLFDFSTTELKIVAMDVVTESFITSIPFPSEYRSL